MPRDRHQRGRVEEVGKRTKKWKGHYYVYLRQEDGTENRAHRAVILGLKAQMKKWEAEKALQDIIDKKASGANVRPSPAYTLGWFWEQRFRPMKQSAWKPSSRPKTIRFIENYIIKAKLVSDPKVTLGDTKLGDLSRFMVQMQLNHLAEKFSKSVVQKFHVYMHAILDEALEQDFIGKNPARKLDMPETRRTCKRTLSEDEITELLGVLSGRDRLIIRMFLVLGLRPGELFALRRNDRIYPSQIRIDESVSEELDTEEGKIVTPKTDSSKAYVWLPASLETELDWWLEHQEAKDPEAFIFPSKIGTPLNLNNYLNRTIKPAAKRALKKMAQQGREIPGGFLEGINHQAFRRTCATQMQGVGTVKDVQAHLRHATPAMTIGVYMQEIPASVRAAVESLDQALRGVASQGELNTIEH